MGKEPSMAALSAGGSSPDRGSAGVIGGPPRVGPEWSRGRLAQATPPAPPRRGLSRPERRVIGMHVRRQTRCSSSFARCVCFAEASRGHPRPSSGAVLLRAAARTGGLVLGRCIAAHARRWRASDLKAAKSPTASARSETCCVALVNRRHAGRHAQGVGVCCIAGTLQPARPAPGGHRLWRGCSPPQSMLPGCETDGRAMMHGVTVGGKLMRGCEECTGSVSAWVLCRRARPAATLSGPASLRPRRISTRRSGSTPCRSRHAQTRDGGGAPLPAMISAAIAPWKRQIRGRGTTALSKSTAWPGAKIVRRHRRPNHHPWPRRRNGAPVAPPGSSIRLTAHNYLRPAALHRRSPCWRTATRSTAWRFDPDPDDRVLPPAAATARLSRRRPLRICWREQPRRLNWCPALHRLPVPSAPPPAGPARLLVRAAAEEARGHPSHRIGPRLRSGLCRGRAISTAISSSA